MRIGITGIDGFLGWHLRTHLHGRAGIEVLGATRSTFSNEQDLSNFVLGCDVIVHLAGMNRGNDDEIQKVNTGLTELLIAACERHERNPHIIFASSTHIYRDTAYGRSKRACSERLSSWAQKRQGRFINLVLPHLFGECGKPFYNSAVATFCYQLANDQKPEILNDGELELIHAQQVASLILEIVEGAKDGEIIASGVRTTVSAVLSSLTGIADLYRNQLIPDLVDPFRLRLFNTYRSYLFPTRFPITLTLHEDNRGSLFEAVKTLSGGQAFLSHTMPGITRGNHYHTEKFERFLVIRGQANIRIRKLFSDTIHEFRVSGDRPCYVDIPTLHTHNITNIGSDGLTTFFWSHQIFNPAALDTIPEAV
jgi:UDP-2-acetamido-2,6-beta-L-arabino-hexul-4-ose reductase